MSSVPIGYPAAIMLLFALLVSAPASPPASLPIQVHVQEARAKVEWEGLGEEAVGLLSRYLAINTENPPGNEHHAVDFLGAFLDQEGIGWERVVLENGRDQLVARIEGTTDAPPLCLMHHMDVASVERERWSRDPYSGEIAEGYVWGRGALDMKGMGILEMMTLVALKRHEIPLARDIVLLGVADEEVGNRGARQLVEMWDTIGCSHLINEGGLGVIDGLVEGQTTHLISVAEKGLLWVRLVAEGRAGHGSTPYPGEAPERLRRAMRKVETRYRSKPVIDPAMYELLRSVGRSAGGFTGAVMRNRGLTNMLVKPRLDKIPATSAAMRDTVHLTGMGGAAEPNVVPSEVWAQYDCRLLPGTSPAEMLDRLKRTTRGMEGVRWEVIAEATANRSPADDPLYEAIAFYAVEGDPDAAAGPILSVGFTDSLHVRPLGVHAYGYVPFAVLPEDVERMHGHDERVPTVQLTEGLRRLFSIVVAFAGER